MKGVIFCRMYVQGVTMRVEKLLKILLLHYWRGVMYGSIGNFIEVRLNYENYFILSSHCALYDFIKLEILIKINKKNLEVTEWWSKKSSKILKLFTQKFHLSKPFLNSHISELYFAFLDSLISQISPLLAHLIFFRN